jgi:hypothetical protein
VRAPKPLAFEGATRSLPAPAVAGESLGRPSETDSRHRLAGHFEFSDLGPPAQLSMPGYHGPKIRNISVRMVVDRLLGARHHTLFAAQIAGQSGTGQSASERDEPATWLEAQSPVPPDSGAFFIPDDWRALSR